MMVRKAAFLLVFAIYMGKYTWAQGCSDAGFCSAGALQAGHKPDLETQKSSIGASIALGEGENNTFIYIPQLEIQKQFKNSGALEVKLPYNIASGKLGTNSGIGDVILTYSKQIRSKEEWLQWSYVFGTRISTAQANANDANGSPLPMVYQTNLGTTDIIAGINLNWKKYLSLAVGWQQPVFQYNHNGYTGTEYFYSKDLKRAGDALFRAEGHYNWKHSGVAAGPLFICHLADDKAEMDGDDIILSGSKGLTLNLTGSFYYQWKHCRFDITAGKPLVVRKYRPDGLTREWVILPRLVFFLPGK